MSNRSACRSRCRCRNRNSWFSPPPPSSSSFSERRCRVRRRPEQLRRLPRTEAVDRLPSRAKIVVNDEGRALVVWYWFNPRDVTNAASRGGAQHPCHPAIPPRPKTTLSRPIALVTRSPLTIPLYPSFDPPRTRRPRRGRSGGRGLPQAGRRESAPPIVSRCSPAMKRDRVLSPFPFPLSSHPFARRTDERKFGGRRVNHEFVQEMKSPR